MTSRDENLPPVTCTECGKAFTPRGGVYGLMCPHCHRGQRQRDETPAGRAATPAPPSLTEEQVAFKRAYDRALAAMARLAMEHMTPKAQVDFAATVALVLNFNLIEHGVVPEVDEEAQANALRAAVESLVSEKSKR